jgi:hypothetical protein
MILVTRILGKWPEFTPKPLDSKQAKVYNNIRQNSARDLKQRRRQVMAKIDVVLGQPDVSPSQQKLLEYLNARSDEVFSYSEAAELANHLGLKESNVRWSLWALEDEEAIAKTRIGRKVYFGSKKAIATLKARRQKLT